MCIREFSEFREFREFRERIPALNSLISLNSLITPRLSVQRMPKHGTRYTKRYVEFRLANDYSIDKLHAGTLVDKLHKLVALIKEIVAHNTRAYANVQYATL